jgi:hypothetical protein
MNIPSSFFEYLNVDVELNVKFKFTFNIQFKSVTSDCSYQTFENGAFFKMNRPKFIFILY